MDDETELKLSQIFEDVSERNWTKVTNTLSTLKESDYAHYTTPRNERTILHSICRLRHDFQKDKNGDGKVDEGAIEVAKILIQASHNHLRLLQEESSLSGGIEKSVLLKQDNACNTPLHNLWENIGDMVPAALVYLILEFCNDGFVTLQDLLSVRNSYGVTVLHLLFGDAGCSEALFKAIITPLASEKVKGKTHPILIGDDDGETPMHFACYVGLEPEKFKILLGHDDDLVDSTRSVDDNDVNNCHLTKYRLTVCESLFCLSKDNKLPMDALCYWFVQEFEEVIHHTISYPTSSDSVDFENLLPYVLNQDENFVDDDLREKIKHELWPRMYVFLEFIVNSIGEPIKASSDRSKSPLHLAASVPTFPSAVLKIAEIISLTHNKDQPYLERVDGRTWSNKIPLHIAASIKPIQLYSYCQSTVYEGFVDLDEDDIICAIEDTTIWQSSREPRSMIQYMLEKYKQSAEEFDDEGRLPLHIAIESGLDFDSNVKPLVESYINALSMIHPLNGLYPFMLAAVCNELDAIFGLLIKDPSMCRIIEISNVL